MTSVSNQMPLLRKRLMLPNSVIIAAIAFLSAGPSHVCGQLDNRGVVSTNPEGEWNVGTDQQIANGQTVRVTVTKSRNGITLFYHPTGNVYTHVRSTAQANKYICRMEKKPNGQETQYSDDARNVTFTEQNTAVQNWKELTFRWIRVIPSPSPGGNSRAEMFQHFATTENYADRNQSTVLNHPSTNGRPDAIVFAKAVQGPWNNNRFPPQSIYVTYDENINKWKIVDEHRKIIELGTRFNVLVMPAGGRAFVQRARKNEPGVLIDHPAANGQEAAFFIITKIRNNGFFTKETMIPQPYLLKFIPTFSPARWSITTRSRDGVIHPDDGFNVLVIKPDDEDVGGLRLRTTPRMFTTGPRARDTQGLTILQRRDHDENDFVDFNMLNRNNKSESSENFLGLLYKQDVGWHIYEFLQPQVPDNIEISRIVISNERINKP